MGEQLDLRPRHCSDPRMGETVRERYESWLRNNPGAWAAFEAECMDWVSLGASRISPRDVIAFVRKQALRTVGDAVKINNTWARCLGEDFVELHPEHAHRFKMIGATS